MKTSTLPWPIRGVLAGAAGTAAMAFAYRAERRLRPSKEGPLDYDDSLVPGQIVASVLHLPSVTARQEHELGSMLRWGYGSAFGMMHEQTASVPSGAVGQPRVRRDAHDGHAVPVPPARQDTTPVALAARRTGDQLRYARRLRQRGGGGQRRPRGPREPRTERPLSARTEPWIAASLSSATHTGLTRAGAGCNESDLPDRLRRRRVPCRGPPIADPRE